MARASRKDRRVLVRWVVSTLMELAGEVPLHANLSMGGGGVILRTGASENPKSQDVALMSVSGGLFYSVNSLFFVIFVIWQEGLDVGIPIEIRAESA